MKHLFYVHSHITDLVAKQVVAHLALKPIDCVFLLARNHKSDFPHQLKFPYTHHPIDSFGVSIAFWKNRKKVDVLDKWLGEITQNEEFIYYTPQSGMNFFYLIVNHSLCKEYCYIEEGLCSYFPASQLQNSKKDLWLRDRLYDLNFKNRAPSVKHFYDLEHPKYKTGYGISEHVFPSLPDRVILSLPFDQKEMKEDYEHVIVLGPYLEFDEMQAATLSTSFRYLLEWMVEHKVEKAHVKYHPAQQKTVSLDLLRSVIKEFEETLTVLEMDQSMVLEDIAISTNAKFYVVLSSVGIYADIAGKEVFSFARKIAELEPTFEKKINALPAFFRETINFI